MKTLALNTLLILFATISWSQVGINIANPIETLEVNGNVISDGSLFLENPGHETQIRDSKLLIRTAGNNIVKYDIDTSKYGPINYAEFVFRELSTNGLRDYDTKISTEKYVVTIQGYYFLECAVNNTNVMTHSNVDDDNIEGHQVYAYKNPATNTWFLRAFVNNAEFQTPELGVFESTPIDIYLNLIIYRKGFISKEHPDITVNMSNLETGVAPLPMGF